jgi:hypothetical protein
MRVYEKKHNKSILCLLIFAVVFAAASCSDAIFFTISQEVKPVDPRIKGTPTNFAVYDNAMYVASGKTVYRYKDGSWTDMEPGGRISQLAATTGALYALCYTDSSSGVEYFIKKYDTTNGWQNVTGNPTGNNLYQHIYAADDVLFISAASSVGQAPTDDYIVLYVQNSSSTTINSSWGTGVKGEISGAVKSGSDYFISTKEHGILHTSGISSAPTAISGSDGIFFVGMIKLDNSSIVAINRNGHIYTVTTSAVTRHGNISLGTRSASGALSLWEDKDDTSKKLLLVGRQEMSEYTVTSGYTYGYVELVLDSSGNITGEYKEPGNGTPTSVVDGNERYTSTIGKRPVNHIFEVLAGVDADRILFASTQNNGVWPYRQRDGEFQWNAEE